MDVCGVDPRDVGWELDQPAYRVYFWSPDGGRCDEYEVCGAKDVHEVLAWADQAAHGRTLEVFALVEGGERGLVRLAGRRPA